MNYFSSAGGLKCILVFIFQIVFSISSCEKENKPGKKKETLTLNQQLDKIELFFEPEKSSSDAAIGLWKLDTAAMVENYLRDYSKSRKLKPGVIKLIRNRIKRALFYLKIKSDLTAIKMVIGPAGRASASFGTWKRLKGTKKIKAEFELKKGESSFIPATLTMSLSGKGKKRRLDFVEERVTMSAFPVKNHATEKIVFRTMYLNNIEAEKNRNAQTPQ